MGKSILITGAGFAGSQLVKKLIARGDKITVLDFIAPLQNWELYDYLEHPNFRYLWKSLQDISPGDIDGHDMVVHLAAQADVPAGFTMPRWTFEQNVIGSVCLLEACRDVKLEKVFYAGSGTEFGRMEEGRDFIDETHPLTPHNPYSASKACAELVFWSYYRCYAIPVVIMSNGIVAGRNMRREVFLFKWLYNILQNKQIILEGGDQSRDVTHINDILNAWTLTIDAPEHKVVGEKFQVSYGEEHTVETLMNWCFEACGKKAKEGENFIRTGYRPGEKGLREKFSNQKARNILGYSPAVGPKEAIRLTKEWIEQEVLNK